MPTKLINFFEHWAGTGLPTKTADAIVTQNANTRTDGLRSLSSLLAVVALLALFFSRRIPAQQPSAPPADETSS